MRYQITRKNTGYIIDECKTLAEAEMLVKIFEENARERNDYIEGNIIIQENEDMEYEFWRIMYYLGKGNTAKAKARYKAMIWDYQELFIDWLNDTYYYEQFDNDDTESLPEIIAIFQQD